MLYFFVIWVEKYSTGWWPPIGGCRSEMELPRPNLTNFDAFFCKKHMTLWIREMTFFRGSVFTYFGLERFIFPSLGRFSEIEGRPSISENHLNGEWWSSSTLLPPIFLMNCITWFSKFEGPFPELRGATVCGILVQVRWCDHEEFRHHHSVFSPKSIF